MTYPFQRYTGAGNTFIVLDTIARPLVLDAKAMGSLVQQLCSKQRGPGADGVICVAQSEVAPFRMDFYNPDGTTGMLCGNGARCAVRAASDGGYATSRALSFEVLGGINQAELLDDGTVRVHFQNPKIIEPNRILDVDGISLETSYLDVGSQHVVLFLPELAPLGVQDIERMDVAAIGPKIRNHPGLRPLGANANFVEVRREGGSSYLRIRTFERGVEGETLACGTGCMCSAIAASIRGLVPAGPVRLLTQSGEFVEVDFELLREPLRVHRLTLTGSANAEERGTFELAIQGPRVVTS